MANGFNPAQSFLAGQSQGLGIQSQRNQLAQQDFSLEQARQQAGTQQRQTGISQEQGRLKFLNNLGRSLKGIRPDRRFAAVQTLSAQAKNFGVDPAVFIEERLTDDSLDQLISVTQNFANDPQSLERERLRLQELTITERRRLAEDKPGLAGKTKRAVLGVEKELLPDLDKQRELAKDAAGLSTEIFGRIDNIEQNILNMNEGIRLIDDGAAVGPINKWLPNLRASTIKLDNLKNRLGLDVIGSVTFGALSAQELKTAFDTAVPSNLRGPALKEWFTERIEAQTKLLASLEEAGIFLSEDGATIPKLMARRRQQRKVVQQPQQPTTQQPTSRTGFTSSGGISFTVE